MKKLLAKLAVKKELAKLGLVEKLKSERGDTNFISIIIILGIVVLLVGAFMIFKDSILETVTEIIEGFEIH